MNNLSKAQFAILSTATQRPDLSVLPLPEALRLRGGAVQKVLTSLRNKGLIQTLEGEAEAQRIVLTGEGMAAVGIEAADEASAEVGKGPTGAERNAAGAIPVADAEAAQGDTELAPAGAGIDPAPRPPLRPGTKQALMIGMLRRPEGATVQQIAEATGWRHHTVRGAISGALKKKLGLNVRRRGCARSALTRRAPRAAARSTGSPADCPAAMPVAFGKGHDIDPATMTQEQHRCRTT